MLENCSRVIDVAPDSAFKIPMSNISPPRRVFLIAQELVSAMAERIGLWQIWWENLMRGWAFGRQLVRADEDDDLMNLDPDRTSESVKSGDLEDEVDEEWRSWWERRGWDDGQ